MWIKFSGSELLSTSKIVTMLFQAYANLAFCSLLFSFFIHGYQLKHPSSVPVLLECFVLPILKCTLILTILGLFNDNTDTIAKTFPVITAINPK